MPAEGHRPLTADLSVEEVIRRWPAVARVFVQRRMHCVGCDIAPFETVTEACHIYGQPLAAVLAELREAAGASTNDDDHQDM